MVSSTVGSGTTTGWNLRAKAASFSMRLRYSSKVVAPTLFFEGTFNTTTNENNKILTSEVRLWPGLASAYWRHPWNLQQPERKIHMCEAPALLLRLVHTPAPTSVCISSMKRITSPLLSWTSFNTAFSLSSNSPRYLAPATSAAVRKDLLHTLQQKAFRIDDLYPYPTTWSSCFANFREHHRW